MPVLINEEEYASASLQPKRIVVVLGLPPFLAIASIWSCSQRLITSKYLLSRRYFTIASRSLESVQTTSVVQANAVESPFRYSLLVRNRESPSAFLYTVPGRWII